MRDYDDEVRRAENSMIRRKHNEAAITAAHKLYYQGETTDPPAGIPLYRWCAMIDSILRNGPPE